MKKYILIIIMIVFFTGCSTENVDLNNAIRQPSASNEKEFILEDEAIDIVLKDLQFFSIDDKGGQVEMLEQIAPTEDEPFWTISLRDSTTQLIYIYSLNGFTGDVLGVALDHQVEENEEELKKEMEETAIWVFENWQSFNPKSYDPTKYGLAFSLNFRLQYIFDNYDENIEKVKEQNIQSQAKVVEVKDVAAVFNEEDHTMYGQMRIVADYSQTIDENKYNEDVEVLIFSKNQLDNDEGWQITNVDMYPINEKTGNFKELFFGFTKTVQ